MRSLPVLLLLAALAGCPGPGPTPVDGGGTDAHVALDAATVDTGETPDAGEIPDAGAVPDAPPDGRSCLTAHAAGDHYTAGDACNFCDCGADGVETCTTRTCTGGIGGCDYDGTAHAYGARFPSTDGCNECVCAASGLACTRRATCGTLEEGAILLESLDERCGEDPFFTPRAVFDGMPHASIDAPFLYDRARVSYPETLPDTTVHVAITRENEFFAVCRLPSLDQPAIDMQVTIEWITDDGAFDEGFPAYLRRNGFGFVDAWYLLASAPLGGLHGSYTPNCALDPGDYSFSVQMEPDGHAFGEVGRVCETDLFFTAATFDHPAP